MVLCRLEFLTLHSVIHFLQLSGDRLGLPFFHLSRMEAFRHPAPSGVPAPSRAAMMPDVMQSMTGLSVTVLTTVPSGTVPGAMVSSPMMSGAGYT